MGEPVTGRTEQPWRRRAVEAEVEEGLLLAEYAVRIRLKNRIIVDTMTAEATIDADAWADEARMMLGRLRLESEASARRMERERDVAEHAQGRARHEHDYRADDAENLDRRRQVYRQVSRRLLAWEGDSNRITALLDAARTDAAGEMDGAIRAAIADDGTPRAEDERLLRQRLRLVTSVDLPALERAVRGEQAPIPVRRPRLRDRFRRRFPGR